ncbi:type 2 DNA topoisomerase 6 subunit B-like [Bidens hawaiensis]|uniref:type 2 DNA topoisomerase 6 subunit B-like n=1 Tax=Bidens hawaiensis TaxID=980011 RepID=UPI0040499FFD
MDASSVTNLCRHLISSAIQRCRTSGELCRLTVSLKPSVEVSGPPLVRVSISDTGAGSCVEEFQDVKRLSDSILNELHNGVISIATTSIRDSEIFHYNIDLKQTDRSKRLAKLPLSFKSGATFSGTEVSFSTFHNVYYLLEDIKYFFQKMLIMKIPMVGIELIVDNGKLTEHQCVNAILANECNDSPSEENDACFKSGLVDYARKHGNKKDCICYSCFPTREHLKTGSGMVCKSKKNTETTIEAVVIVSESSELIDPSCSRVCGSKTEVIYFSDFLPGMVSQPLLKALQGINWKKYGLSIKSISEEDGCAYIEWDDLPQGSHIDIAIHCHHNKLNLPPSTESTVDKNLASKAVKLALNDLKEKNNGVLLSAHAVKIRSYAPDLANTIAGLISTSKDSKFKKECASLLGLSSHDEKSIKDIIKQKIISVIDSNDREPQTKRKKEIGHLLFNDASSEESEFTYDDSDDDEVSFSCFDL